MLDLEQYKDILGLALDHQLARLKGGLVFDDFDPAVDSDKILRARVERLVKQKKVDKLEKMLQELIVKFQHNDPFNFTSVLYQKTGYQIAPIHNQHLPLLPFQNLRMGM